MRFLHTSGASLQTHWSCSSLSVSLLLQNAACYRRVCNRWLMRLQPVSLQRYLPGWSGSSPDALSPPIIPGALLRASEGESEGERSESRGAGWEGDTTMSLWGFQELKVKLQP